MAYRKLTADKLFNGYQFEEEKALVLDEANRVVDLVALAEAGEGVKRYEGVLSPGFVNCHCHLELSHLKGKLPERTGLVDFVSAIVGQRGAPSEVIAEAIAAAEAEMKSGGIVAVGDICNTADTLPQKAAHNLRYHNFIEASGWLPSVSAERLARAEALRKIFTDSLQYPNLSISQSATTSIVPHAPYSVSKGLWKALEPYFAGEIVSIHNQETACEDEFFQHGTGDILRMYEQMKLDNSHHLPTGRTSLQSYFHHLAKARNILLVHNTFTSQPDIDYILQEPATGHQPSTGNHQPETFFCLCPNANLFIEGVLPPIEIFRKNNCSVVLGTDSLASNWSLSIMDEIKAIRKGCPDVSLDEALRWATINGAKALGLDVELGSFEMGKKPGVVLVDEFKFSAQAIFS